MAPDRNSLASLALQIREQTPGTEEREALLERLAAEVRAGTYRVDAEILAAKLLKQIPVSSVSDKAPETTTEKASETKS